MNKTKVVFRWYRDTKECIALFPQNVADNYGFLCSSYMYISQHGATDTQVVISQTRPATQKEYMPLYRELRGRGYKLDIRKRCTRRDQEIRMEDAKVN